MWLELVRKELLAARGAHGLGGARRSRPVRSAPAGNGEKVFTDGIARPDSAIDVHVAAYRRQLGERPFSAGALSCPRCRLRVLPRWPVLAPRYCPRCLARYRVAVELQPRGGGNGVKREIGTPRPPGPFELSVDPGSHDCPEGLSSTASS